MLKLYEKELKLNVHPLLFLFSLCGAMVLIPSYPYIVAIWYSLLQVFIYMQYLNEIRALEFSAMLPVKRADIVSSTTLVIVTFQGLNLIVAAICAYPSHLLTPAGNVAGLDANLTFFGVALFGLGAFNAAFIPSRFKTGYKIFLPILWGLLAFLGVYGISEGLVQTIPTLTAALDGFDTKYIWCRLTVLAIGTIMYTLLTFGANKLAIKKFEKVNL